MFFGFLIHNEVTPVPQGLLKAFTNSDRVQNTKQANSAPTLVFPNMSYRAPTA
jgi:hypothetical protein